MPETDPEGHREDSSSPPLAESSDRPFSPDGSGLADDERSRLIEDAKRFKESHEQTFRLLSREGASQEETFGENK